MGKQLKLKKIGENLKLYREAAGRAVAVVAESLGVEETFLNKVESGRKELDFIQYIGIAELYKIGFSNIFENNNGNYFYCPKIPTRIIDYISKQADEYCKEKHITKRHLFAVLETNEVSFSHFRRGLCMPTPQRVENMIALFGLSYVTLKNLMVDTESKPETEVVVENTPKEEPIKQDAMALVTEALEYYKNKEKHIASLHKIISEAQRLIDELNGGAV